MEKQKALDFLVRNMDKWPTKKKFAPVVSGFVWAKDKDGLLFLLSNGDLFSTPFDDWCIECSEWEEQNGILQAIKDAMSNIHSRLFKSIINQSPVVPPPKVRRGDLMKEWNSNNYQLPSKFHIAEKDKHKIKGIPPLKTSIDDEGNTYLYADTDKTDEPEMGLFSTFESLKDNEYPPIPDTDTQTVHNYADKPKSITVGNVTTTTYKNGDTNIFIKAK